MDKHQIEIATHNMTEGHVTDEVAAADLIFGQEIDRRKIRDVRTRKHYMPDEDPHLAIMWNPNKIHVNAAYAIRVHGHGRNKEIPFPTPARHVVAVEGSLLLTDTPFMGIDGWPVNSAWNILPDKYKAIRRELWWDYWLKMTEVAHSGLAAGKVVFIGTDTNKFRGTYTPHGMLQATRGWGLDRIFYSNDPRVRLVGKTWDGPITGVGPDMKHKSKHVLVDVRKRAHTPAHAAR